MSRYQVRTPLWKECRIVVNTTGLCLTSKVILSWAQENFGLGEVLAADERRRYYDLGPMY